MSRKRIISVGYSIPGDEDEYEGFDSDRSLLDADIILFQPDLPEGYFSSSEHAGRTILYKSYSFRAVQQSAHWQSELSAALDEGKTVIVFLTPPDEVLVYTNAQSGSAFRYQHDLLRPFSNYSCLPVEIVAHKRRGDAVKVAADVGQFASYWEEFGPSSPYQVYIEGNFTKTLLTTKSGNKVLGALIKIGKGTIILLPPVEYDEEEFTEYTSEGEEWNDEGIKFGKRLISALVALDRAINSTSTATPPPEWVTTPEYKLQREVKLESELADLRGQLEQLQTRFNDKTLELDDEGKLRRLLFETGSELEAAILDALRILGFSAEGVREGESEFDAVFVSPEGRFLGEAEGKDRKAVNIDKLSQLERNIQEDFARDDVGEYAKGVLFGNAFRLSELSERGAYFTDKCISGARRAGAALVRTPDLFFAAKYVRETGDTTYAQACREAIKSAEGVIVTFPPTPVSERVTDYSKAPPKSKEEKAPAKGSKGRGGKK
jgi:hypothetical protein